VYCRGQVGPTLCSPSTTARRSARACFLASQSTQVFVPKICRSFRNPLIEPPNNALHPAARRGASSLKARRCSAPAAAERERWTDSERYLALEGCSRASHEAPESAWINDW
jgi:hypothetical protein